MDSPTALLQSLVRIPSVNPEGDPDVAPDGERMVAEAVAEFLKPIGFDICMEEVEPGRPNLIARAPGPENRPRILLGPHLDTVGVSGMTIPPYDGELADGKIRGRGASDTKGPMTAMLWGLRQNASELDSMPVAVDFVGFMGEESSQPGSKHFARNHASEYEFAIVGEPTNLEAVYCTKGSLWATIAAHGRAAHASQPHLGDNAILKLIDSVTSLHERLLDLLVNSFHPILGTSTLNVGQISGGTRPNIVPDMATATIDLRTVPELVREKSATELLREHLHDIDLVDAVENPPMEMSPDHPWLDRFRSIFPELKLAGAPWFSDAAHLSAAGLPSICLGPGSIDQAHTADEFITVNALNEGADWFTRLIAGLKSAT